MAFAFPRLSASTLDGLRGYVHPEGRVSPLTGTALFPSVTTILKTMDQPGLDLWKVTTERDMWRTASGELYAEIAGLPKLSPIAYLDTLDRRVGTLRAYTKQQQAALDVGSSAHHYIDYQIRKGLGQTVGKEPAIHPQAMWAYMAVEDWFMQHRVKPVYVEAQVFSHTGYAGTFDLLATVDGQLSLIDWKTSKALYPENDLQLAAYAQALRDMGHPEIARAIVIRIPKEEHETAVEVHEVEDWERLVPTFHALCTVWQWWYAADRASKAAWQAKRQQVA